MLRVAIVASGKTGGIYEQSLGAHFPPLAAAYLSAVAIQAGYEVKFFDASTEKLSVKRLSEKVLEFRPDIVGFILNATSYASDSIKVAEYLKSIGKTFNVAGGHHATFCYKHLLQGPFDAIVLREGETTFYSLLRALREGNSISEILGLAYKNEKGEILVNPPRKFITNLDDLPFPAFEIFDKRKYKIGLLEPNASAITIETSRGCPYNCEYCSVTKMWGGSWRLKSVTRIIKELKKVSELGYRWVFFVDDNFIVPAKKIIEERLTLLKEIIESGLSKLRYIVQMRADFVAKNEYIAKKLYDAGVRVVFLGIESGEPETLRRMRKNISLDESAKAVNILSKEGIIVHAGFIIGAPYESEKNMNKTIEYALNLIDFGLDSAQFSIYTPFPGTDAFSSAVKEGRLLTADWKMFDALHPVMKTSISPLKLFMKNRLAYYRFFFIKGLRSLKKGKLFSKPKSEKEVYLNFGKKYLMKRIPLYIYGIFRLPFAALKLKLKLMNSLDEEALKMLNDVALNAEVQSTRVKKELAPSLS